MFRKLTIAAGLLVVVAVTQAQPVARAKAVLDTLCNPQFAGRGYVANGDRLAASYIRRQFSQLGLQPLSNSYYQFFTLTVNTFPDRVALQVDDKMLITGTEFIALPGSGNGKGKLKLQRIDSTQLTSEAQILQLSKSRFRKRGLLFSSPQVYERSNYYPDLQAAISKAPMHIVLQPGKLTASLSSKQEQPVQLEVLEYAWQATAHKVKYAIDANVQQNYISQNVIGYIKGALQPDSFIVFSAHYDHLGTMGRDVHFAGANDNACGVAMLLELARYYATQGTPPPYSMVFIAFGGEEVGLIGSKFFTDHPLVALNSIKFLLNLDLVGTGEEGITVVNGKVFTKEFEQLKALNQKGNYLPVVNSRGEAANSDHYYFTKLGVKSFFIYTLGARKAYHDVHDIPETIPFSKYTELISLLQDFVANLTAKPVNK